MFVFKNEWLIAVKNNKNNKKFSDFMIIHLLNSKYIQNGSYQ